MLLRTYLPCWESKVACNVIHSSAESKFYLSSGAKSSVDRPTTNTPEALSYLPYSCIKVADDTIIKFVISDADFKVTKQKKTCCKEVFFQFGVHASINISKDDTDQRS